MDARYCEHISSLTLVQHNPKPFHVAEQTSASLSLCGKSRVCRKYYIAFKETLYALLATLAMVLVKRDVTWECMPAVMLRMELFVYRR
jgi:hypothetical protein